MASIASVSKVVVVSHAATQRRAKTTHVAARGALTKQFGAAQLSAGARAQPAQGRTTQMVFAEATGYLENRFAGNQFAPGKPVKLPRGLNSYETMFLMLPDATDEETTIEVQKIESCLTENGAEEVEVQIRGRQPLAYDMAGHEEALYVQMNYLSPGKAPHNLETMLATPTLGDRKLVMRFMTHRLNIKD